MKKLIKKLENIPNNRIGQDIYIAFEWSIAEGRERKLNRIYIGSKTNGPMLQWFRPSSLYNGHAEVDFNEGAWTNLYSRGNFSKKYAFGGNWSGHTKNLHPRLSKSPICDKNLEVLKIDGFEPMVLPLGIKGNISVTDYDCTGSWVIWYASAKEAFSERLACNEIKQSNLPAITKQHLLKNETQEVLDCFSDVIDAYNL